MTKQEKIKLLLTFINTNGNSEARFRRQVEALDLPGSPEARARGIDKLTIAYSDQQEAFIDAIEHIYDANLDEQTIDDSIAFYTSESGEKMTAAMSKIKDGVDVVSARFSDLTLRMLLEFIGEESDPDE